MCLVSKLHLPLSFSWFTNLGSYCAANSKNEQKNKAQHTTGIRNSVILPTITDLGGLNLQYYMNTSLAKLGYKMFLFFMIK